MSTTPDSSSHPSGGNLFVHGGRVVGPDGPAPADVSIRDGRVVAVGTDIEPEDDQTTVDATGAWVLPGQIDPQVHFREPGMPQKEDLASGSRAAVAGGVTTFLEMPNTKPSTTTAEALDDKFARAKGRSLADHGFFVGAAGENVEELAVLERHPGCPGIKMFMGSSTGSLLVSDDDTVEAVLRSGTKRVTVHSEDEELLQANYKNLAPNTPVTEHHNVRSIEAAVRCTTRLLNLAEKTGRPVHVLHISTAEEIDLILERDLGDLVTCEATPNHLFLAAPECYERYGAWAQMNPPVREQRHQDRLRRALTEGPVACIGSDHAPHTIEDKARPYPQCPSGIPGVQTTLALLLTAVRDGWLSWADLLRLTITGPCEVYGLQNKGLIAPGNDGDLAIVDPELTDNPGEDWLQSRSKANPFLDREWAGRTVTTVVRGQVVWHQGEAVGDPIGAPVSFSQ